MNQHEPQFQQAASFPGFPPAPLLERTNVLDDIDRLFEEEGATAVVLEGLRNCGRTTLLSLYARRHAEHSIVNYVRETQPFTYDASYVRRDFASQITAIIGVRAEPGGALPEDAYEHLAYAVAKYAKKCPVYFLLDALDELPAQSKGPAKEILRLVPSTTAGVRLLLTARTATDLPTVSGHVRSLPVPGLVRAEVATLFAGTPATAQNLDDWLAVTRGSPGKLAGIRRLLLRGVAGIESTGKVTSESVFEQEWIPPEDEEQELLLAIVCIEPHRWSVEDLSRLVQKTVPWVLASLERLPMLRLVSETGRVAIISDAFAPLVRSKVERRISAARDAVIGELMKRQSADDLAELPARLLEAGRQEDLLALLSPDYFLKTIETCRSTRPLADSAALGLSAAMRSDDVPAAVRMAVQRSILAGVAEDDLRLREVLAHLAVGDYTGAISVAHGASLDITRLRLLSRVHRARASRGLPVDTTLEEKIETLCEHLEKSASGSEGWLLAEDLVFARPARALRIAERLVASEPAGEGRDGRLARLAIRATAEGSSSDGSVEEFLHRTTAGIENPGLKRVVLELGRRLEICTSADVLALMAKVEGQRSKMLLLRQWATANAHQEGAGEIARVGLRLLTEDASGSVSCLDVFELAAPLESQESAPSVAQFVSEVDALDERLAERGPTVEYVRLQLRVARFYVAIKDRAHETVALLRASDAAQKADDTATRFEAFCHIHAWKTTRSSLKNGDAELPPGLAVVRGSGDYIERVFDELLVKTAEQFDATRRGISILATASLEHPRSLAARLNTEWRRDAAMGIVLATASRHAAVAPVTAVLDVLQSVVSDGRWRAQVLLDCLEAFRERGDKLSLRDLEACVTASDALPGRQSRFESRVHLLGLLEVAKSLAAEDRTRLQVHIASSISEDIESLDGYPARVQAACRAVVALAPVDSAAAQAWLVKLREFKRTAGVGGDDAETLLFRMARLAIMAWSGLFKQSLDTQEQEERVLELLKTIPSAGNRAFLRCDVSMRYLIAGRKDKASSHVARAWQDIEELRARDSERLHRLLVAVAPALFLSQPARTRSELNSLPEHVRDDAYAAIADGILRRCGLDEPYDARDDDNRARELEDLFLALDAIGECRQDESVYDVVRVVCASIENSTRGGYAGITREAAASVLGKCRELAMRLPLGRSVDHRGWSLMTQVAICSAERAKVGDWEALVDAAEAIPNLADGALVLCGILRKLPSKMDALRKRLVKSVEERMPVIAGATDKVGRALLYAERLWEIGERGSAKRIIKTAVRAAGANVGSEAGELTRDVIDCAYRLDPALADELAQEFEGDPVRRRAQRAVHRARALEALHAGSAPTPSIRDDLVLACKRSLGQLNAARRSALPVERVLTALKTASEAPLEDSFWIIAWALAHANRKYAETDQAGRRLGPIATAVLDAANVAVRVARMQPSGVLRPTEGDAGTLVVPGARRDALDRLRSWIEVETTSSVWICDPYFDVTSLEIVRVLHVVRPDLDVKVITTPRERVPQDGNWGRHYHDYWQRHVAADAPPRLEIVHMTTGGEAPGSGPLHDRWILGELTGIASGASVKDMGHARASDLRVMTRDETVERRQFLERFIIRRERSYNGLRLNYVAFTV